MSDQQHSKTLEGLVLEYEINDQRTTVKEIREEFERALNATSEVSLVEKEVTTLGGKSSSVLTLKGLPSHIANITSTRLDLYMRDEGAVSFIQHIDLTVTWTKPGGSTGTMTWFSPIFDHVPIHDVVYDAHRKAAIQRQLDLHINDPLLKMQGEKFKVSGNDLPKFSAASHLEPGTQGKEMAQSILITKDDRRPIRLNLKPDSAKIICASVDTSWGEVDVDTRGALHNVCMFLSLVAPDCLWGRVPSLIDILTETYLQGIGQFYQSELSY